MPKQLLVRDHSLNTFFKTFQPREFFAEISRGDFYHGSFGHDEIWVKNSPELDEFDSVLFDVKDFGRTTGITIQARTEYIIEKYDHFLSKLIKKKSE